MMAKAIRALGLHYLIIQFLIITIIFFVRVRMSELRKSQQEDYLWRYQLSM